MSERTFPEPISGIIATLVQLYRVDRRDDLVELLEKSSARFVEINYNKEYDSFYGRVGEVTTWELRFEAPVPVFATLGPRLSEIQKEISGRLNYYRFLYPNDLISGVTILPIARVEAAFGERIGPSEIEVRRLWPKGRFHLFISHVSAHKVAVSKLKDELELLGISGFVAHEAIQPSLEWQREIELALRSMHALLPLITPDFHASNWTDQEVGWAFGRGVLVVPVRLGVDPYGFAGKVQGITGDLEKSKTLAKSVFDTLLANPQTHNEMRRALVTAFCDAGSFIHAIMLRDYIPEITDFTDEEKASMRDACETNSQLSGAYMVPETIYKAFGKPTKPKSGQAAGDEVLF